MTPVEILKAARELISVPERWTQKALARDDNDKVVWYGDFRATCFCAEGALKRVCVVGDDDRDYMVAYLYLSAIADKSPHHFNDAHTHAEVLALFDRAIASAPSGASEGER